MSRPTWDVLVAQGRKLVVQETNVRWGLGDLALEVAPWGKDGVNTGAEKTLDRFAEEIGVEFESLRKYRLVAHAWPAGTRVPAVAWTVHRELMNHPDRAKLIHPGMKSREAIRAAGRRPHLEDRAKMYEAGGSAITPETVAALPRQQRREIAEEALSDPKVARAFARGSTLASRRVANEIETERTERRERVRETREEIRDGSALPLPAHMSRMVVQMNAWANGLDGLYDELDSLPAGPARDSVYRAARNLEEQAHRWAEALRPHLSKIAALGDGVIEGRLTRT